MNYIDQNNQEIRERQHRLQDEIDLLETDIQNTSISHVYDTKSIENIFILRLGSTKPSRRGIGKYVKKTGWTRSHHFWTPEIITELLKAVNDGITNEELIFNDWGFTLNAIKSKLYKLGFKYQNNCWVQK